MRRLALVLLVAALPAGAQAHGVPSHGGGVWPQVVVGVPLDTAQPPLAPPCSCGSALQPPVAPPGRHWHVGPSCPAECSAEPAREAPAPRPSHPSSGTP